VSRITELLAKAKANDPQFGADLEREFRALSSRLSFGLNFERHRPEAVELPQRPVRRGDKVRILPPRGSVAKGDPRLWLVDGIHKTKKTADLKLLGASKSEAQTVALEDLVVVAEFRDTIYPGLVSTGKVSRGGDKPWHTVINGENYHTLKALTWTHRGKVDVIYIDPPYNTGAKDWKYNNDYVEGDDLYRHSKWLAFMERRLLIARELLKPEDSVLIVTIDEKEYLRLGLLLEQTFPEARIQMISSVINPKGVVRSAEFARVNEYIFMCRLGNQSIHPESDADADAESAVQMNWQPLRRSDIDSARHGAVYRKLQFYPIYVSRDSGRIIEIGDPIPREADRLAVPQRSGCDAVFPVREDGTEIVWGVSADTLRKLHAQGFVRIGSHMPLKPQPWMIQYLTSGRIKDIETGKATVLGRDEQGAVIAVYKSAEDRGKMPATQWDRQSHNAQHYGTLLLKDFMPDRRFPFPKSLYAVEDSLRYFVRGKPDAVILDFFAGSGTTAHAVMRLNRQDGGQRQAILVTNNEVSADEQRAMRESGARPGDAEWESRGICEYITKPRVTAAIAGVTPAGAVIAGNYKFTDEFPMADGFAENAEFFTLTYETPVAVSYQTAFECIAPLLWLRAGSKGRRIDRLPSAGWDVVEAYGLLVDLDTATDFLKAARKAKSLRVAFIVTDDERRFQALSRRLPEGVEAVRLYESYLTNFAFANGEGT
jgi:adenine-specific DNA-methyltransferase